MSSPIHPDPTSLTVGDATLSPAAVDLLWALNHHHGPVAPPDIRDTRGRGWPNARKRAGLLARLVHTGVAERHRGGRYQISELGRRTLRNGGS